MIGVIDTSALLRLYIPDGPVPDGFTSFFRGVERGANKAVAPELLLVEAANVLNRKRMLGLLSAEESIGLLTDIRSLPIRYFPHDPIISSAFDIARENHITVYDALYLALAREHGGFVFSADIKMNTVAKQMALVPGNK